MLVLRTILRTYKMNDPLLSRKVFGSPISVQSFLIVSQENIRKLCFYVISAIEKETTLNGSNYMSHLIHFNYHTHILYKYFEISIHIGKSKSQLLITISTKFLKCIIYTKLRWFYFIRWKLSFKYLSYMVKFGYFLLTNEFLWNSRKMFISCLGVDLASSFSTEALLPLLADKELQKRLLPFLPAVENLPESEDELRQTIQSPQFKQVGW